MPPSAEQPVRMAGCLAALHPCLRLQVRDRTQHRCSQLCLNIVRVHSEGSCGLPMMPA